MTQRSNAIPSDRFLAWTLRLSRDLLKEVSAIRIRELDRAFMATKKGMLYAPPEDQYYNDDQWRDRH